MGFLARTRCYLAGPVENSDDYSVWRNDIAGQLREMEIDVYDPITKPQWMQPTCRIKDQSAYRRILNSNKPESIDGLIIDKQEIFSANAEMREIDLRLVFVVDWVICYLPSNKPTYGTIEEVTAAISMGKPVFFCCPNGIPSMWLLAAASDMHNYTDVFFNDWKSLIEHVHRLDNMSVSIDPHVWPAPCWIQYAERQMDDFRKITHVSDY